MEGGLVENQEPGPEEPARFVYAMCRAPWPGRDAASYHRKIDRFKEDQLIQIGVDVWGVAEPRGVSDMLHRAVNEVLFDTRNDVADLTVRDRTFLITGGLAQPGWDPTEAFELIRLLDASRVTLIRDEDQGPYKRKPPEGDVVRMRPDPDGVVEFEVEIPVAQAQLERLLNQIIGIDAQEPTD